MARPRQHASVILMVLVTIAFAAAALLAFTERAMDDLIQPTRVVNANRLRAEAYSAMETVLAVLVDWRAANGNNLRSPTEGWDNILNEDWVGYAPYDEHRTVTVTFDDESGKLSLPAISDQNLVNYFTYYGLGADQAAFLKDTLLTWMRPNYTPTSAGAYTTAQYQEDTLPFSPPGRSLRSWAELASIEGLRAPSAEVNEGDPYFFYLDGRPTPLGKRFMHAFSLYNFTTPNANGALHYPDTIAILGQMSPQQQEEVVHFLRTKESGSATVPNTGFFTQAAQVQSVAGTLSAPAGMGVNITALRINVTVKQGLAVFTLSVLVTWPNGATAVAAPAPPSQATTATNTTNQVTTTPLTTVQLNYPYTVLELKESDLDPDDPAVQTAAAELETPLLNPPST